MTPGGLALLTLRCALLQPGAMGKILLKEGPPDTRSAATIWRRGRHELPLCVAAFTHANFQVASSSAAHTPATDVHGSVGCRIPTVTVRESPSPAPRLFHTRLRISCSRQRQRVPSVPRPIFAHGHIRACVWMEPCRPAAVLWYACCRVPRSYRPHLWYCTV